MGELLNFNSARMKHEKDAIASPQPSVNVKLNLITLEFSIRPMLKKCQREVAEVSP